MGRQIKTSADKMENCESNTIERPKMFSDYIGQNVVKEHMKIYIQSAKKRNDVLDHVLLYGQAGLGKTTLVGIIANEMGKELKVISAPAITKAGDIAAILARVKDGDVLFIDEIHRLPIVCEETLYSAMEDYKIDIIIGSNSQTKSISLGLPKFTLIGATTRTGMLSKPLKDRFGITEHLEYYTSEELKQIVDNSAKKLNICLDDKVAAEIGNRSKGTPRIANHLLCRVRDFAISKNHKKIQYEDVQSTMELLGLDEFGLSKEDNYYLRIIEKHQPVGLTTIASYLGEDKQTVEEDIEPYLLYKHFITKTPKGRILN